MTTHTFITITTTPCGTSTGIIDDITGAGDLPEETGDQGMRPISRGRDHLPPPLPRMTMLPARGPLPGAASQLPIGATSGTPNGIETVLTPTEEVMALDLSMSPGSDAGPAQPIFFNRDGTVTRHGQAPGATDSQGRPVNVHELLKTKDWSQTPLGPRDAWPQSLKTIGMTGRSVALTVSVSLIMQYPHQCCLWWGKELTLIYNAHYADVIHRSATIHR